MKYLILIALMIFNIIALIVSLIANTDTYTYKLFVIVMVLCVGFLAIIDAIEENKS